MQKFLIVVASALVVSSALPQNPYFNGLGLYQSSYLNRHGLDLFQNSYLNRQMAYQPAKPGIYPASYSPAAVSRQAPVAPVAPAVPVSSVGPTAPAVPVDPVAAPESSELNMLSLMKLIPEFTPMLSELLKKGTNILNTLMPKLPYLLKNAPPTLRSDIAAVNQIIADVCDKVMERTQNTRTWSYYSPEGIQATCRFINEKANEVLTAFDDPSIVDNYLGHLNIFSGNLEQKSYIQQHQTHRLIENQFE